MDKYNYLTLISEVPHGQHAKALFRCVCGKEKYIRYDSVKAGNIKSCGCMAKYLLSQRKNDLKHGGYGTRIYNIYHKMKARCCNPNYHESRYYSERGIQICDEWLQDFTVFREWALSHGYNDNLSIDRIDPDKGYSPDNCRWASPKQQSRNKRNNIIITHNGETHILVEWCEILGLPYGTIAKRIREGWDKERAILEPIRR